MQGSFDFTEQKEIVKHKKRKTLEARQDWRLAPKIPCELLGITL